MASFARAGQLHAAHVCSLHVARGRRQVASLFFHQYISSKKDNSHWDFFFSLWSLSLFYLCSDISGAIRAIASCEISLACRGDNWECGMWEVCWPKQAAGRQHGLWNVDSKTKATSLCSSPVLVFWSSSMSPSDLINWDTSHEKRIKEPLKSLWSALYVWDYTDVLVIYIFLHSFFSKSKEVQKVVQL